MKIPFSALTLGLAVLIGLASKSPAEEEKPHRYLYMATPDGAQGEGQSGSALLVFDIDDGHRFVKRIPIESLHWGVRGLTGCTATGCLYYSTSNMTLGCFDVAEEKVIWERKFDRGCDRSCITPDGKLLYVPTGWWYRGDDGGFLVVDAATGEPVKTIAVGKSAHNSIATPDGRFVYLGTTTRLTQFDAKDGSVLKTIEPVGEAGVFPFTVDSKSHRAYVCLGKHVGFDVVDLADGKAVHRIFATDPKTGEKIPHRTHGAGMTPDETELWISDQKGKRLFVFDLTKTPPAPAGHLDLSMGGHGWVTFSLDGTFAYSHTPDVFDTRTKKLVATLRDENGKPFASSKFIEVQVDDDGKVIEIGCEFGIGRK